MKAVQIKPNTYWVGGIDWNLRYFHGYLTPRGTTYNSYLIMDEKVTLVDTVKYYLFEEMLERIKSVIDPQKIDYLVINHVEMDHAGSLLKLIEAAPNAEIVTSSKGKRGLEKHFNREFKCLIVDSGEELNLGSYSLQFYHTPMVHWPDSMVTYIPENKLLLPNDAFGQHIASPERFDDELGWDLLKEEAAKYYANIVLPYGDQVKKALEALSQLDIDMIAPSHGVIWRSYLEKIIPNYISWASHETEERALIVYDTMWGATEKIAVKLQSALQKAGWPVTIKFLQTSHMSEIMPEVLRSRLILVGSSTLNNGMLPSVAGFLTYMKGLRPKKRVGMAFGSFGWGGQGAKEVEEILKSLEWDMPVEAVNIQYTPNEGELETVEEAVQKLVNVS